MWALLFAITPLVVAVHAQSPSSNVVDGIAIPAGWAVAAVTPGAGADASKVSPVADSQPTTASVPQGGAARSPQVAAPKMDGLMSASTRFLGPAAAGAALTPAFSSRPRLPPAQPLPSVPVALHAVAASRTKGVSGSEVRKPEAEGAENKKGKEKTSRKESKTTSASNATAPAPSPMAAPGPAPAPGPVMESLNPAMQGALVAPAGEAAPSEGTAPVIAKKVLDKIVSVECLQKTLKDPSYVCSKTNYVGGPPPPPPPPPPPKAEEHEEVVTVDKSELIAAVHQARQYARDAEEASANANKAAARAEELAEKLGMEEGKTTKSDDELAGMSGSFVASSRHHEVKLFRHTHIKSVIIKKPPLIMHKKRRPSLLHSKL